MEEIQKNMREGSMEQFVSSTKDTWMTPDLMSKLQSNPELLQGFSDPEIMQAIALMQVKPVEAKQKYQKNEKVTKFFVEFTKLMGGHFEQIGEKEDKQVKNQPKDESKKVETPGADLKKVSEVKKASPKPKQDPSPLLSTTDPVLAKKLEDPGVKVHT